MITGHMPTGIVEIDRDGTISHFNAKGEVLLNPIIAAYNLCSDNLYPVLEKISPDLVDSIKNSPDDCPNIITNEHYSFSFSFGGEQIERHYSFTAINIFSDCILISFDDVTLKEIQKKAIMELTLEKAITQGKFEIVTNVLHDIGNAVVGFATYLNRIQHSIEQNKPENLQNLAGFFAARQNELNTMLGEAKTSALVNMLNNMTDAQKNSQDEIKKSVKEQLNILTHIQDILNIQRHYLTGNEQQEKKPLQLRSIIKDCMSMLSGSFEKRGIKVSMNVPAGLPTIQGNRTKLMQVVLNVLKNSIEAIDINAEEKCININASHDNLSFTLQIQDNGHGFDEDTAKQIFMRGFTTKASGTGLGLDSCRAIVEAHDGTMNITSKGFGKGALTTIHFKI